MKVALSILVILFPVPSFAQINLNDSSMQVVAYWSKKEKQSYKVIDSNYKVVGSDTSDREAIKYNVDITVLDSTTNSYTVEWLYKDKVIIKTNEYGAFTEVVNWKQVRDEVNKAFVTISKKYNEPAMQQVLKNVKEMYTTKESIESAAIQDIQQFHTFHGGKYVLNEDIENKLVSNGVAGAPVDVLTTVRLAELDGENNFGVVKYWKDFDSKQMTDATYQVMKQMTTSTGAKLPAREEIPEITYQEYIGSTIHGTGWVIYSLHSKQTDEGDQITVQRREIEIL
jgi:hypothetical protein